jgi:glycosyltransferase involved in cell wall biosynthesis
VHVHDLPVLPLGSFLKKRLGVKLVYDAHELYSYQPGLSKQRAESLFAMEKQFISTADLVVLINDDQAEVMQKDFGRFPFVSLTNATKPPPGFDRSKKYNVIREKCGIPAEEPVLLFQGGVNRLRKIHLLIEGVAKAKSAPHMVFLTWGGEIEEFKLLAKELGIQTRCHFMPPIPWDEMVYWAASADLGVMPYQADDLNTKLSMPNKMYEFIVAGTPMVGSEKLVNVNKIVGGNGFGALANLVHAEDYAAIIDFALAPDRIRAYRESLRLNGAKYSWGVLSADFVEAYDKLFAPEYSKNQVRTELPATAGEI